jgi:5-methylcytosine-specific restriction endonuclease McrA
MTRRDLDEYLQSPEWMVVRAEAIERAGHMCEQCGFTRKLQVHHVSYSRLGNELPEDLKVLCRQCHDAEHHSHNWTF